MLVSPQLSPVKTTDLVSSVDGSDMDSDTVIGMLLCVAFGFVEFSIYLQKCSTITSKHFLFHAFPSGESIQYMCIYYVNLFAFIQELRALGLVAPSIHYKPVASKIKKNL